MRNEDRKLIARIARDLLLQMSATRILLSEQKRTGKLTPDQEWYLAKLEEQQQSEKR